MLLGGANEWIQSYTLGRHAAMNDVMANGVGILVFMLGGLCSLAVVDDKVGLSK